MNTKSILSFFSVILPVILVAFATYTFFVDVCAALVAWMITFFIILFTIFLIFTPWGFFAVIAHADMYRESIKIMHMASKNFWDTFLLTHEVYNCSFYNMACQYAAYLREEPLVLAGIILVLVLLWRNKTELLKF